MRQIAIFCILQLHFAIAFCQAYQPLAADTALARQAVEAKRQLWLSRLPANSNEWLKEAYEGRYNYLQYAVQNQHFLYGSALQPFLDSVVAEICRTNPENRPLRCGFHHQSGYDNPCSHEAVRRRSYQS